MYGNKFSDQLLPLLTPEMLVHYPDQTCDILNKLIRLAQKSSTTTVEGGGTGNLENIVQTSTSYADGGVNIVTAYLSDGTTQDFQIRNGHQGSQGEQGETGPQGEQGVQGVQGVQGEQGPQGVQGPQGPSGKDFSIYKTYPSIADMNADLANVPEGDFVMIASDPSDPDNAKLYVRGSNSFVYIADLSGAQGVKGDTGDTGPQGPQGEQGIQGVQGPQGIQGPTGTAATITVGSTSTLSPGSSATVTNSGTSSAAVFDFGIPQGATGAAGPANTLSIGTVTGGATAAATITGTSPNQTLNLTLPKGDKGDTGSKGDPGTGCPIGTILPFSGSVIPNNYLECDGSAVSRTTYADLFDVIGTTYGAGDGSTTFNLPNLKGKVTVGQDVNDTDFDTLGETGGEKTHTLTEQEMPSHRHYMFTESGGTTENTEQSPARWATSGTDYPYSIRGNANAASFFRTGLAGSGNAHNNLQPYIVTKFIIKFSDDAMTAANVLNTSSASTTDVYSAGYVSSNFQPKDSVTTITKNLQFNTSWTDTGITGPDLPESGLYAMYVLVSSGTGGQWWAGYSATISWISSDTNDTKTDEILLIHTGHADNGSDNGQRLFLRIAMTGGHNYSKLQYAFKLGTFQHVTGNIQFTFRRLI